VVTDDAGAALDALSRGEPVVLIIPPGAPRPPGPPDRLAVLVGAAADPGVRRAAEEMDAELHRGPMVLT